MEGKGKDDDGTLTLRVISRVESEVRVLSDFRLDFSHLSLDGLLLVRSVPLSCVFPGRRPFVDWTDSFHVLRPRLARRHPPAVVPV